MKKVKKLVTDPFPNVPHAMTKKTMTEIVKTILRINTTKIVVRIEDEMKIAKRETAIETDLDTEIMTIDEIIGKMIEIDATIDPIGLVTLIGLRTTDTKKNQKNHGHQIQLTPAATSSIDFN